MADPLLLSRALHYTTTILATGVLSFRGLIAGPARLQSEKVGVDRQLLLIFWAGLALAFFSGAGWLLSVSAAIDGGTWGRAVADGTAAMVLTETQFGHVWIVRLVVGLLLGAAVGAVSPGLWRRSFELALAAVFAGSLAFAGHAASAPGFKGDIHLLSDALHIIAVCAWVGGLVPYALYLGSIDEGSRSSFADIEDVTRRFSSLGMLAVLTIATTGIVNSFYLVGSVHLFTHTEYGRLLLIKVALFIAMVGVAAINRYRLVPALSSRGAVKQLRRNSLIEVCFGLSILCIVAVLGTMPPAALEQAESRLGLGHLSAFGANWFANLAFSQCLSLQVSMLVKRNWQYAA